MRPHVPIGMKTQFKKIKRHEDKVTACKISWPNHRDNGILDVTLTAAHNDSPPALHILFLSGQVYGTFTITAISEAKFQHETNLKPKSHDRKVWKEGENPGE